MMRNSNSIYLVFFFIVLPGCTLGIDFMSGIPLPFPNIDEPFRSIAYYKKNDGVDLLKKNHDMKEEINFKRTTAELLDKLVVIKVNGVKTHGPYYNDKHLLNSKKIGSNEYEVKALNTGLIERQLREDYCWAASIKYFLSREYGVSSDQKKIVDAVKKDLSPGDDRAGSVKDMMEALGFSGLRITPNGSHHLIEVLGRNHIAIVGLKNKNNSIGHAVVVVGAKYSFVNNVWPKEKPQHNIAFSELTILDPAEGKKITVPAENIENNIEFILTQDPVAIDLEQTIPRI